MKKTPEDAVFAVRFGEELRRHYDRETTPDSGQMSDEDFASSLDVSRAALMRYLAGEAMPSVRVLVLAFLRYGIALDYFGTPVFGKRKRKSEHPDAAPTQLVLPFSVQGLNAASIRTKIEPRGQNGFELRVDIRRAS